MKAARGVLLGALVGGLAGILAFFGASLALGLFAGLATEFRLEAAFGFGALFGAAIAKIPPKPRQHPATLILTALIGAALAWLAGERLGQPGGIWLILTGGASGALSAYALRDLPGEPGGRETYETLGLKGLRAVGFLFFVFVVVFPFWAMLVASLKPRAEFLADPANLSLPTHLFASGLGAGLAKVLEGYRAVLVDYNFLRYIANTAYVSITTMVLTLFLSVLGAYAVARLEFRGRGLMERAVLLTYMFPAIVLAIPLYVVFTQLGMRNTLSGLIIVYLAQTLPVALYMLRSYFETIPQSLEEAGLIDGCSRLEVIWRITLPLSLPALASVGLYVFMIAWNEFLFAFMFLDAPEIFTLSRGMVALNNQEVPYQYLMAGAVIVTVPVMLLFFWFERYLIGGLTAGGVKG